MEEFKKKKEVSKEGTESSMKKLKRFNF